MGIVRDSFVIFKNWTDALNELPEEYQLEAYKSLMEFACTGAMPTSTSAVVKAMLVSFSFNVEKTIVKYNASIENGRKGGRPPKMPNPNEPNPKTKGENDNLEKPSETQPNPNEPNPNLNVNVNVNVNDNVPSSEGVNTPVRACEGSSKPSKEYKAESLKEFVIGGIESERLRAAVLEWLEYKKYDYQAIGIQKLVTLASNNARSYSEDAVCNLIDECISSGYKGITWDRLKNIRQNNTNIKKHGKVDDIDFAAILAEYAE